MFYLPISKLRSQPYLLIHKFNKKITKKPALAHIHVHRITLNIDHGSVEELSSEGPVIWSSKALLTDRCGTRDSLRTNEIHKKISFHL